MWAYRLTRPARLERVEVPAPDPAALLPGRVLLRVLAGAICGSDLPFFTGQRAMSLPDGDPVAAGVPGFPLHEVVGEVVASDDPALPPGSRAVGWADPMTGLAQYCHSDAHQLLPVPPDLDASTALTLQPLACVLGTYRALGDVSGRRVAVLGLGPFGLLFAHVAAALGATTVVGVDRVDRSDVAARFGVDVLVHATSDRWSATIPDDERPHVVVEAVGHQTATLTHAIAAVAPGGLVFAFGVPDEPVYPVPLLELFRKAATLRAGVIGERRDALAAADRYLRAHPGLHEAFVTHRFPMAQAQQAFETAARPSTGRLKVQLIVTGDP